MLNVDINKFGSFLIIWRLLNYRINFYLESQYFKPTEAQSSDIVALLLELHVLVQEKDEEDKWRMRKTHYLIT